MLTNRFFDSILFDNLIKQTQYISGKCDTNLVLNLKTTGIQLPTNTG